MDPISAALIIACLGLAIGAAWLAVRARLRLQQLISEKASLTAQLKNTQDQLGKADDLLATAREKAEEEARAARDLEIDKTRLEENLQNTQRNLGERDALEKRFADTFQALSSKTLDRQQKGFITNADQTLKAREEAVAKLVKPLSDKIETLDKAVARHSGELGGQIKNVVQSNRELRDALSKPQVRGQWGEMNVERVLELCSLVKNIHYTSQDPDGQGGRTDFIVHMPHKRDLILDSKVPLTSYLDAESADNDEDRNEHLDRHARMVQSHADSLSKKEYWRNLGDAADFVVMVVPEFALPPALLRRPDLLDRGLQNKVVIVTYSTLAALLKCVALSWQERKVADEARSISELGRDLHNRLVTFAGHMDGMGRALNTAVNKYNAGVGSMESRVMAQARRFRDMGVPATQDLPEVRIVDAAPRAPMRLGETDDDQP